MSFELYKMAYKTLHYADSRKNDHKRPEGYATERLNRTTSQAVGGAIGGAAGAVIGGATGMSIAGKPEMGLIGAYYGGAVGGTVGAQISDFRSIRRGDRQAGYKPTGAGKYFVRGVASGAGALAGAAAGSLTGSVYGAAGGAVLGGMGADYAVRKTWLRKKKKVKK